MEAKGDVCKLWWHYGFHVPHLVPVNACIIIIAMALEGTMDMDVALWSQLPLELVEKVLSFMPVLDLCQYRSVCKTWNELICSPTFAIVHAQNGKRQGASFIAMEMQGFGKLTWCLLDLNAQRWYTFNNNSHIINCHRKAHNDFQFPAMDGGLICCYASTEPEMVSLFVFDLLGHIVKSLPLTKCHLGFSILPKVHMVVDNASHHFMIFLLNRGFVWTILDDLDTTSEERLKIINDPLMCIYDSATDKWRSTSNPPWIEDYRHFDVASMVMCQGRLYALMQDLKGWTALCYNSAEDAWNRTPFHLINFWRHRCPCPQLIAISTRLFVTSWDPNCGYDEDYDFEVSEIIFPQMTLEMLFKLSILDVMKLLEVKMTNDPHIHLYNLGLHVTGVDNTLFVHSKLSAKVKVFDLDTHSWDHGIPEHPLEILGCSRGSSTEIVKQTNLLLPNSIQYFI